MKSKKEEIMSTTYQEFIEQKLKSVPQNGFETSLEINPLLYEYERDIVLWALRQGKAAIWADCGLGKTFMQIEWAHHILYHHKNARILILAPLAVSYQTIKEGDKLGISITLSSDMSNCKEPGIYITNYAKLHKFDLKLFNGLILDESSILKNYAGKYRNQLISESSKITYKLACTATPSPNDFEEIGNHSEFLNVLSRKEMLSMFFIHDSSNTSSWRLKNHGAAKFWEWLSEWAVILRTPSDLGYSNNGFDLPPINFTRHTIKQKKASDGWLFPVEAKTLKERRAAKRATLIERCECVANLVQKRQQTKNPYSIVWCNLNDESRALSKLIPNSIEVTGSLPDEEKEKRIMQFTNQEHGILCLISKPSICGFGMNWQHCAHAVYTGLSDSYEQYYQSIRRIWRHKQENPVQIDIVVANTEGAIVKNIMRKEHDANQLFSNMIKNTFSLSKKHIKSKKIIHKKDQWVPPITTDDYTLYHGDCVQILPQIKSQSIGYCLFSPPFADLYIYSDTPCDMGNSKNYKEFLDHFEYMVKEIVRCMKPGRLISFHCMDIPAMKERDGYIGLKDFPAQLVKIFESHGCIYHSKHIIWKDPLTEATRTKALGLMHKQLQKDSTMCRAGLPDYLITVRIPGKNQEPVKHHEGLMNYAGTDTIPLKDGIKRSHLIWRKYASPVWMDIRQTHTLNAPIKNKDEKHICPLQLDTIERGIILYSNPGDIVFTPFMGIGSEVYQAIRLGRKAIGVELKQEWFEISKKNAELAKQQTRSLWE